jgi:hypothetical protein
MSVGRVAGSFAGDRQIFASRSRQVSVRTWSSSDATGDARIRREV